MNNEEKQKNDDLANRLVSEQNFAAGDFAWAVATLLAAVAYVDLVCWFVVAFVAVFLAARSLSRSERFAVGLFESRD